MHRQHLMALQNSDSDSWADCGVHSRAGSPHVDDSDVDIALAQVNVTGQTYSMSDSMLNQQKHNNETLGWRQQRQFLTFFSGMWTWANIL